MHHKDRTILVTGATGRQGGAVARHLLAHWTVRALTRDPKKPAAKALAELGAQVVAGDLEDRDSLANALEGCYGVFSVQNYWEAGAEGEIRQGKIIADEAKTAGVDHFVYSSVACADRQTGIPHFDSKWQVEQYLRLLELPLTVIRPVFFMENFAAPPMRDGILAGRLRMAMAFDRPLQMIAVDDIGAFATMAFEEPAEWKGRVLDIAGDELVMPQVAEAFSRAIGRPVHYEPVPLEELRQASPDLAVMFQWFNEHGYDCDIPSLRRIHPKLMTFQTWLESIGWQKVMQEVAFGGHA